MTDRKIREVIDRYREYFKYVRVRPVKSGPDATPMITLPHAARMLGKIEDFVSEGHNLKAQQWLGFVQGTLWSAGAFPIREMDSHNRPDPEPHED